LLANLATTISTYDEAAAGQAAIPFWGNCKPFKEDLLDT
jgi:hypothetical protein